MARHRCRATGSRALSLAGPEKYASGLAYFSGPRTPWTLVFMCVAGFGILGVFGVVFWSGNQAKTMVFLDTSGWVLHAPSTFLLIPLLYTREFQPAGAKYVIFWGVTKIRIGNIAVAKMQ